MDSDKSYLNDLQPKTEETVLYIKGIKRPTTIYMISDSHMKLYDENDHPYVCNHIDSVIKWFHENWNRTDEADSVDIFDVQIDTIRAAKPDITVMAGDIICGPTKCGIEKIARTCEKLGRWMFVPGNHDWENGVAREHSGTSPEQIYTPLNKEETLELFREILTPEEFSFQVQEVNGLLLIGLDNSEYQFTKQQVELLKEQLGKQQPCILFMHVPVYTEELKAAYEPWCIAGIPEEVAQTASEKISKKFLPTKETLEFINLLKQPDTPIKAIFAGHVHFTHQAPLINGVMQYTVDMSMNGTIRKIMLFPDET